MKKMMKTAAACMVLTMALTACGSGSSAGTTTATETASETAAESSAETAEGGSAAEGETAAETEDTSVYAFDYDVASIVELGQYKELEYTITDTSVSEEEVQAAIDDDLTSQSTYMEVTDRKVEEGDTVNIDFEGIMDGEAFDGGTAQGYTLEIGSHSFIDGFEDGLIGVKPGNEVALDLSFPDEYPNNPDLAGKPVTFNVTVNYIQGDKLVPELTDVFVNTLGIEGVETVDAYKAYVEEYLQSTKEEEALSNKQAELFTQAVDNATIKEYPQALLDQCKAEYSDYYNQYASMFGLDFETFLSQYMQMTVEDFEKSADEYAKTATGNLLVSYAITVAEGYEVTDEIFAERLAFFSEQSGMDGETLVSQYGERYIRQIILNDKAMEIMEESAVGVEARETEAAK